MLSDRPGSFLSAAFSIVICFALSNRQDSSLVISSNNTMTQPGTGSPHNLRGWAFHMIAVFPITRCRQCQAIANRSNPAGLGALGTRVSDMPLPQQAFMGISHVN